MEQTNASDDLQSISMRISFVAALQLELITENQEFLDDSNNTNRFADLARLTVRVQTSGLNRRTRLIILNRLAVLISSASVLKLELCSENRQRVSR
eukprot:1176634-Pyramimonas_sp.AAC.1